MYGKTITLFTRGASYKNLKSAELDNWTGKAYLGERKHIETIQTIEELNAPGLYFLLSQNEETSQTILYIGEADCVAVRIKQHYQKDWWNKFVTFISKDSNLNKAHVRYLEKQLYDIAKSNPTTIELKNSSSPTGSSLPESDKSNMAVFQENMIFVLNNLGIIDFAKISEEKESSKINNKDIFYLSLSKERKDKDGNVLQGKMLIGESGYLLLKGSPIESHTRTSFKIHNYYKLRQKLDSTGCFKSSDIDEILITTEDIYFNSPSAAAAVVKNRATNGRAEWKLLDGTTLDDFEAKQL